MPFFQTENSSSASATRSTRIATTLSMNAPGPAEHELQQYLWKIRRATAGWSLLDTASLDGKLHLGSSPRVHRNRTPTNL